MKKFLRKYNKLANQKGFSLVELMVVVAIIGILAAIAIPNYQRFQRKSQQVEPKTQMSGIYTAQITFVTEHGIGTNNILQSGFSPDGLVSYRVGFSKSDADGTLFDPNVTTLPAGSTYRGAPAIDQNLFDTLALCNSAQKDKCGLATGVDATNSVPWNTFNGGSCTSPTGTPALGGCSCNSPPTCGVVAATVGANTCGGCTFQTGANFFVTNSQRFKPTFTIGAIGDIGGSDMDQWTMTQNKVMLNVKDGSQ